MVLVRGPWFITSITQKRKHRALSLRWAALMTCASSTPLLYPPPSSVLCPFYRWGR